MKKEGILNSLPFRLLVALAAGIIVGLALSAADGTVLTFGANEPYLIAEDGSCWSCPEFFNEMKKEIE